MPTNETVIKFITGTVCVLAFICVAAFCIQTYRGIEVSQGFSLLTGGLVGSLTSMLTKTTPTETTKQPLPSGGGSSPAKVEVINKPDSPVPTTETTT